MLVTTGVVLVLVLVFKIVVCPSFSSFPMRYPKTCNLRSCILESEEEEG